MGLIDKIILPTAKAKTDCQVVHVARDVLNALAAENSYLAEPC